MKTPTPGTAPAPTEPLSEEQEAINELHQLGSKIRDWQKSQLPELSDNKMISRFVGLGSTKTYLRVINGQTAELSIEKQLAAYRAVWQQIQEEAPKPVAEFRLDTLGTVAKARLACLEARSTQGNDRFVLIEGDTGCGKTMALKCIADKYAGTVMVEASAAWKDSPSAFLTDIYIELGGDGNHTLSQPRLLREVIAILKRQRRIVCIDEGHEMQVQCLNTLRTLINKTECTFAVAAMHTLWERIANKAAYEETRQLVGNRLQRRVKLHRVSSVDAARLIQAITGIEGDPESKDSTTVLAEAAALLVRDCQRHGNLKFIARCAATAKSLAGDEPVTLAKIITAKAAELEKR